MSLRYLRHNMSLAAKAPFQRVMRQGRMEQFINAMDLQEGTRILDMGGAAEFWESCPVPLDLTVVNLPDAISDVSPPKQHEVKIVEGDACNMSFVEDQSFDIAFSNSVIEHVGNAEKRAAFAREMHRAAPRHWVQTPSIWFPIEAHNHMPFWWFYPPGMKRRIINGWRKKLPEWTEMIEGTTVVMRKEIETLYPDSKIWVERVVGIPKSYVAHSI